MQNNWLVVAWILGAYLVGGIPFGYLIGRLRGVDVRRVGSCNIGATNVFRTVGKKWGLLAFFCDVMKGLLPTLAIKASLGTRFAPDVSWSLYLPLLVGVMCVVGHMLTPYMGFKGGKGVATAFGMLLGLVPALVGVAFAIFALTFALSHFISLGSCVAALFLAIAVWFPILGTEGRANIPQAVLITVLSLFIVVKHRSNLRRLAKGTENKIYLFKANAQAKK